MKKRITLLAGVFLLLAGLGLGLAQTTVVLNSTYVPWDDPFNGPGWVRVSFMGFSKHIQDDAISNMALLRFDISHLPQGSQINSASLKYYRQKSESGATMYIYHITDDSWNPDLNTPPELYDWPTSGSPLTEATGTTGWNTKDITAWLQAEVDSGQAWFSIKFQEQVVDPGVRERIASPTAWHSLHRPEIVVVYSDTTTPKSDLTVNRHDIVFSNMWPVPYDPATITATVHNVGAAATATSFPVRFLDNGVPIGNDVWITSPIPGGGGTATAQITWYPTEGDHSIEVIADPNDPYPGRIVETNEYNNSNIQNYDDYNFEVRGQYKYYAESFETDFGRWQKDADENGGQLWDVTRVSGSAHDGSYYLQMDLQPTFDNGTVWIERSIPIPADANAVKMVELSFFAHNGAGLYANNTKMWGGWYGPDIDEDMWLGCQLSFSMWRRCRSYSFLGSAPLPEYWVGGGYHQYQTNSPPNEFFDLYTIRVDPPHACTALASAYNNGTKLVWDGLSAHHLIYLSGDTVYYSRSEDPSGDSWTKRELVGMGDFPSIALGSDGYPRAVWVSGAVLYYSKRTAMGWSAPHGLIQFL